MIKLKPVWWVVIISLAVIIPLSIVFLITRVVLDPHASWWWFFGVMIIQAILGLVVGIIVIVYKFSAKKAPKMRLSPKDARDRVIHEIKYDTDNPDNFIIEEQIIKRVGERGHPRTPIAHFHGKGSELNQVIDAIVNLDNPKLEWTRLNNATHAQIQDAIKFMAENPESEITEKTVTGMDQFGRPVQTTIRKQMSESERELEQEKKEAELNNIY